MSVSGFLQQYKEFADIRYEAACRIGSLTAETFDETLDYLMEKHSYWKVISYLIGYITKRRSNNFDLYANLVKGLLANSSYIEHKDYLIHQLSIFVIRRLLNNGTVDLDYLKSVIYVNQADAIIDLLNIDKEYPKYSKLIYNEEWVLSGVDPESLLSIIQKDDAAEMNSAIANGNGDLKQKIPIPFLIFHNLEIPNVIRNGDYFSPMDMAAFFGSVQCFKSLLIQNCSTSDFTIYCSIMGGSLEIFRLLMERASRHLDISPIAEVASSLCQFDMVRWLNEIHDIFPSNQFDVATDLSFVDSSVRFSKIIESEILGEEDPYIDNGYFTQRTRLYFAILHNINVSKRIFSNCLTDDGCFIGTANAIEAAKALIKLGYKKANVAALRPNDPEFFDWALTISKPTSIERDTDFTRVWAHMDISRRKQMEYGFFSFGKAAWKRLVLSTLIAEGDTNSAVMLIGHNIHYEMSDALVAPPEIVEPFFAKTNVSICDRCLMLKDVPRYLDRIKMVTSFPAAIPINQKSPNLSIASLTYDAPIQWLDFVCMYLRHNNHFYKEYDVFRLDDDRD